MLVFGWLHVRHMLVQHSARYRLEQAKLAAGNPNKTRSEAFTFGVLCIVSIFAGFGFAVASMFAPERSPQLYGIALSFAFFFNFNLFLMRFGHFQSALCNIDHIERLSRLLRRGPSTPRFVDMRWTGQRPANDF